jgi:hypothetical protein
MRDRRFSLAAVAAVAALVLGLAGCGGSSGGPHAGSGGSGASNGVASQTANQIVRRATQAIESVSSVHVSGSVADGSHRITLDLHLVNGKGATGSLSENGLSFRLIALGSEAYVNGSPGFWRQFGGAPAERLLHGQWLRAPARSGDFASFSSLTDVHRLLSGLLAGHGALTRGSTTTIDGTPVVAVQDAAKGGTLYVATTGTPYPIRIANRSVSGGRLDFGSFNQPVTLAAPAHSIDISRLG